MVAASPLSLVTSDGLNLEAEVGVADDARAVAVICHPHPLHGGDMFASVVNELFTTLPTKGVNALRFNFRGVGQSEGSHDYGQAERLDVTAAVDAAIEQWPGLPVLLAGWSFGANVSLTVDHPGVAAWFAVAPPLGAASADSLFVAGTDPRMSTLVIPAHDQFNPPDKARPATADWVNTDLVDVDGADHFLNGYLHEVTRFALESVHKLHQ